MKQTAFACIAKRKTTFGGALLGSNTNPKSKRPLDSKLPLHVVLRARESVLRLPRNAGRVDKAVYRIARKYGVRIYGYANVGNHLHACVKLSRRGAWAPFIRELTSLIARVVGARAKFWASRPFTRVVSGWRKAFRTLKEYIVLNRLEAEGIVTRQDLAVLKELRRSLGEPPGRLHAYG